MLELYHFNGATCGLKARLSLAEKGVDYIERAVDREFLRTPEYRAIHPSGVVPALVHNGNIVLESSVVINYVDDAFDGKSLKPDSPIGIARAWWWMKKADEHLPMIAILTYTISMRPKLLREKSREELKVYIDGIADPVNRERRREILTNGFESAAFPQALLSMHELLTQMENSLTEASWLAGDKYSLADIAMTPLIERLMELNMAELFEYNRPNLVKWWKHIQARDSYRICSLENPNPEKQQHLTAGTEAWPLIRSIVKK